MVNKYKVKGYEEFTKLVESLESTGEFIHVMYSGGKEEETGKSWCPYCVKGKLMGIQYSRQHLNTSSGTPSSRARHLRDTRESGSAE